MPKDQLQSLLEGLMVPNIDIWLKQPPETLKALGALISMKASQAPEEMTLSAEAQLESMIVTDEPKIVLLN